METSKNRLSECCGAPMCAETDFCSGCLDHSGEEKICGNCGFVLDNTENELCQDCYENEIWGMKYG